MARPQNSQDMGPAQEDQAPAVAQAAPTTAVAPNGIAICLFLGFIYPARPFGDDLQAPARL